MNKLQITSFREPTLKECYVSIAFGGGFALDSYTATSDHCEETKGTLNPWFFSTLFHLLKEDALFQDASFDIQPSSAIISFEGDETLAESKLTSMLTQLPELRISEESFRVAKEASNFAFRQSLDSARNKSLWKILEFMNINKGFTPTKFLASYDNFNEQDFRESLSMLISSANAHLFIASATTDEIVKRLQEHNLSKWLKVNKIAWCVRMLDPYLTNDVNFGTRAEKKRWQSALNVCFGFQKLRQEQRLLLTDIYASALSAINAEVENDPFDSSIWVGQIGESSLRSQLSLENESRFEKAKQQTINKYLALMHCDTGQFVRLCANRSLWGINMLEYMNALSKLTFSLFQDLVEAGDVILREARFVIDEGACA